MFNDTCISTKSVPGALALITLFASATTFVLGIVINIFIIVYKKYENTSIWYKLCMVSSALVAASGSLFVYYIFNVVLYSINLGISVCAIIVWINLIVIIPLEAEFADSYKIKIIYAADVVVLLIAVMVGIVLYVHEYYYLHIISITAIHTYCLIILCYATIISNTFSGNTNKRKYCILVRIFVAIVSLNVAIDVVAAIFPCIYFYVWMSTITMLSIMSATWFSVQAAVIHMNMAY